MQITQIPLKQKVDLVKEALQKAISYSDYKALVALQVENKTNTGAEVTAGLTDYTLLNHKRMKRLSKTVRLDSSVLERIAARTSPIEWLVITESWCGDAAQSTPVMEKFTEANPNINLKVVLRDYNPELMNAFLTNGSKSIPKLIAFDTAQNKILGDWGPRPTKATQLVADYKAMHGSLSPEFKQDLQVWYNKDKGQDIANDLLELL